MDAGFSEVPLLPPRASLAGVADGRMPRFYTSVRDEPAARAVALDDGTTRVVLVTAGLLTFPGAFARAVRDAVRADLPDGVAVALHADHTHSGPGNYWDHPLAHRFLGPFLPEVRDFLVDRLARAIRTAWAARAAATLRVGHADVPGVTRNRRRADGPVDPRLTVLAFHRGDGAPAGLLVHFAAHPRIVAESTAFHAASGDWPATVCRALGAGFPWVGVVNGALGAIDPVFPDGAYDPEPVIGAFAGPVAAGARAALADAAEVAPLLAFARRWAPVGGFHAMPFPPGFAWWTPLAWPAVRVWDRLARMRMPDADRAPVSALRIGPVALVLHPSDLGVGCGLRTRALGRELGLDALPVSHADDYAGYVHPRDEMLRVPERRDPYRFFTIYENLMGFHGRDAADAFAVAEREALAAVASPARDESRA